MLQQQIASLKREVQNYKDDLESKRGGVLSDLASSFKRSASPLRRQGSKSPASPSFKKIFSSKAKLNDAEVADTRSVLFSTAAEGH